jgi:glycosyltransferase involved in cell wall biosynthesis
MKASVLLMTYNHINYIRQALDSVLMQETDFDVEILISEDCSTDGTREVVLDYYRHYPDKIRLLLSEQNIHSNEVVVRGIEAAQGDYIALLDGDDYWSSHYKLQKQADYLDQHSECSMCFHNALVFYEDGKREPWPWTPPGHKEISTLEDIWLGNFIATCSTMFRNHLTGKIPDWYISMFPITDWPLHILNAELGHIGYINEVMGMYRHHRGGFYSPLSEAQKLEETLKFYQVMNHNFDFKYNRVVKTAISKYFFEWAEEYANRGDRARARDCFKTYLTGRPINQYISLKQMLILALRLYKPSLLSFRHPYELKSSRAR